LFIYSSCAASHGPTVVAAVARALVATERSTHARAVVAALLPTDSIAIVATHHAADAAHGAAVDRAHLETVEEATTQYVVSTRIEKEFLWDF
jgi:hypothetical protein